MDQSAESTDRPTEHARERADIPRPSPDARCAHPGCDRRATEVAVVESAWEDAATGSALMVCSDHAESYVRPGQDQMLRAHRRPSGSRGRRTPPASNAETASRR